MPEKKRIYKLEISTGSYTLLALSSAESFHKVGWHINQSLSLNLTDGGNITVEFPGHRDVSFPVLKDDASQPETTFALIKNRQYNGTLVKTLPNVDYFLKITGSLNEINLQNYLKQFKAIDCITAAVKVNPQTNKHFRVFDDI